MQLSKSLGVMKKMTLKFEMIFVCLLYVTYIQKLGLLGDFYFFKRGTGE